MTPLAPTPSAESLEAKVAELREKLAEAIDKARYVPDGISYFGWHEAGKRDREYAYRLADVVVPAVLSALSAQRSKIDEMRARWRSDVGAAPKDRTIEINVRAEWSARSERWYVPGLGYPAMQNVTQWRDCGPPENEAAPEAPAVQGERS